MSAVSQMLMLGGGGKVNITYRDSAQDETDLTTYTFTNMAIGPAAANRYVVVGFGGRAAAARSVASVTIGGITATEVITANNPNAGSDIASIFIALVPTGTTATVVITWSAAMVRCICGAYSMTGNSVITKFSENHTGSTGTSPSFTLTTPANGASLAIVWAQSSVSATVTWTGPTEDFDLQTSSPAFAVSGASQNAVSALTSQTITATIANVTGNPAMAAAAWAP